MKIGFFTETYHPQINGVVEQIDTSAKELEARGHEVYIICPKTPNFKDKNKRVIRIPSIKIHSNPEQRFILPLPEKNFREVFKTPFDIIHGQSGVPALLFGLEISRIKNVPFVFTYHTLLNRYTHYILKGKLVTPKMIEIGSKLFCNLSDVVIAPTERVKSELISYGVTKKIIVIPGGIDTEKFTNVEKGLLRKKFKIAKREKILLYIGRLGKEKSVDFLIRALKLISPEATLFIVGDGPEKENLKTLSAKLKINKKIIFTGFIEVKDVPKVYADTDVFVFASRTETQGLVIMEAMASFLPIVAVSDAAFETSVIDGKNGFQTKPSESDFAQKVEKLLNDKKLREKMGLESRRLSLERFSASLQAERLEKLYQETISQYYKEKRNRLEIIKQKFTQFSNYLKINAAVDKLKQAMLSYGEERK